jgi:hypothetical protein
MSFGRYVDHANMSEEPAVSMRSVKTQTVDSSEISVSVLSPRFRPVVWLSSFPFAREMTREAQREGSDCEDKFGCGRRGKNSEYSADGVSCKM